MEDKKNIIKSGQAVLGIELGSTRIKAVLIDEKSNQLASGGFNWENSQIDGIWTYPLEDVKKGLQACYADLKNDVSKKYGITLSNLKAMGISAMMHGYLAFDSAGKLLVPFRTWRNNITAEASAGLTELFNYPIPQRWSIAHLYMAILKGEQHISRIAEITTLAGYVHKLLTGKSVLGIGDASGMFPIDTATKSFNSGMLDIFDKAVESAKPGWKLSQILPKTLEAGELAGELTKDGAALLDPDGDLAAGIWLCPPEGDAGTGMVATNSVRQRTGNVSAGTSVFAMLVLEKELAKVHHEIDQVTTPDGSLVAMAHSNNCSTEYSAWIDLLGEAARALGAEVETDKLYDTMMRLALKGDPDCGGILSYGYHSGEHITGFTEGRPLLVRNPDSRFTLENLVRSQLFTSLCALRTGLNILLDEEKVEVDEIKGHGGFFKTEGVGERIMAAATGVPVSVLSTAGEGGAWGIALLASYSARTDKAVKLPDYLDALFGEGSDNAVKPETADIEGFNRFFSLYHKGLAIEQAAVDNI